MKQKLLELLQSTEGFLSGQELSDHLNVSRTAVWKVMKSLEEDGYEIEAVRNKGYSLKKEPDILTKESCASRINTKWLGKNLMVYDVTDSLHGAGGKSEGQTFKRGPDRKGRSFICSGYL